MTNNKEIIKKCPLLAILFSTTILLNGCALKSNDETRVEQNAKARWDALINNDLEEAYQYYTKAYRKDMPYDYFKNHIRGVGSWKEAEIVSVNCKNRKTICEVSTKISVNLQMRGVMKPTVVSDTIRETWVYEGWLSGWHYIDS